MSLVAYGKRSLFDDAHSPLPASKKLRCGGNNSAWNPSSQSLENAHLSHLKWVFPHMDEQLLNETLESCDNDLNSAIKNLNEPQLTPSEKTPYPSESTTDLEVGSEVHLYSEVPGGRFTTEMPIDIGYAKAFIISLPANGSEWVELLVREISSAGSFDDAREQASRALDLLEKTIVGRTAGLVENLQKEDFLLKEQLHCLVRDNNILKRAVAIQHERQKEHEEGGYELQHLKQLLSQCQDQIRTLEVNNYALTLHLRKGQESISIPGCFNHDVF